MLRGGVISLGIVHPCIDDFLCAVPVFPSKLIGCRSVEGADGVGESVPESLRVVIEINAFSLTEQLDPFLALGLGELAIGVKVSLLEGLPELSLIAVHQLNEV